MSTELTLANERGQSMAELMGLSSTASAEASPSIARIGMIHQPKMGEIEFNGKMIKTEVLPIGCFTLTQGEDVTYAKEVHVRIFAQRQQWTRWNSETEEMEKTVMSNSLNGDLKDTIGGFNLGRPSGWIEDFNALDDKTKAIIRSVKRTKVLYGTVTLMEPQDESGNPKSGEYVDIPFVYDIKNNTSIKNLDRVMKALQNKNLLPIMSSIKLTGGIGSIPTGAQFGFVEAALGDKIDISEHDNDTLRNFIELIEYSNGKILDLHNERNSESLSDEDAAMVGDIINNDFVEVQE